MGRNVQTLRKDASVLTCLIQHIDEVRVFEDVCNLRGAKQVFDILRDAGRQSAPFTESFPDFHGVGGGLFFLQKQVELVDVVSRGFTCGSVGSNTPPDLILNNQHTDFLQLIAKLLDVVTHQTIVDVHIGAVVEQLQGTLNIDFQSRCDMVGFLFVLFQKCVIQVLQNRHILRNRIVEILLVDLMHTTVDNRLFDRLQAIFTAHNQLTEGQDEVGFQSHRVIILGVVQVDVHGVDIVGTGRTDLHDLTVELVNQSRIFCFRVADDNVIIGNEERIGDLTLCGEGLTGTGSTEDKSVGVLQFLSVHHDKVIGQSVQTVVEGFFTILEQFLRSERHKNSRGTGSQTTTNLDQVLCQRQTAHQTLFLLKIQSAQVAVMLLGNTLCLEHIVFQFLLGATGIHHKECQHEHSLVLALKLFQECLCILTISGKVRGNDVHIVAGTDSLFLFLDLGTVKLRNGSLDGLDCRSLVYRLDVHGHDLTGLHIQKVCKHTVTQVGCRDLKIRHRSIDTAHLESAVGLKSEGSRCNKVLYGQTGLHKVLPVKEELVVVAHVEHGVHQAKSFLAVHRGCDNTQTAEVVKQVVFDVLKSRLCLSHRISFNAESQELSLCQTVVALRQLLFQHLTVLGTDGVERILTERNTDTLFKALRIGTHVHKGQFKVDGTIKEVQESAPLIKDGSFIFLLCQLIVDVLKLNGLGIKTVGDSADAVREHSLEGNGLLGSLRYTIVFLGSLHNSFNFSLLLAIQICRHFYFSCLRLLLEKQFALPPFQDDTDAPERRNSCSSDKGEPWDE